MAPRSSPPPPASVPGPPAPVLVSSFCTGHGCVGIALEPGGVAVVDTKVGDGPALRFTPAEWAAFVAGVKNGEFDVE